MNAKPHTWRMKWTKNICRAAITTLLLWPHAASAAETVTQVTTYVIKTQEDRQSTRFTLTEWLRIKERMKLMDVWLAMFSDPNKDKFSPELLLSGFSTQGKLNYSSSNGESESGSVSGRSYMGQLWLTNIVSSTLGVHSLNIDFGVEGFGRQTTSFNSTSFTSTGAVAGASSSIGRQLSLTSYSADLRLFGRNIQDSSLVFKAGRYQTTNTIIDPVNLAATNSTLSGRMLGANLQLYLIKALGAEGGYMGLGPSGSSQGAADASGITRGAYYHYEGFVEVSILRLLVGSYVETWDLTRQGQSVRSAEKGYVAGIKLQF